MTTQGLLLAAFWLLVLDFAAWNVGSLVLDRLKSSSGPARSGRAVIALVLGFTGLGTVTFLLAATQLLYASLLVVLVAGLALHGLLRLMLVCFRGELVAGAGAPIDPFTWVALGYMACVLPVCFVPSVPHDSLVYHLAFPELYLRHHGLVTLPYDVNNSMPHYVDLLFAPAMTVGGIVTPTLLMWQFSVFIVLGFRLAAGRLGVPRLGGIASLLYLANPLIQWHVPITYIEPAIGCFILYAFVMLSDYRRTQSTASLAYCAWLVGWAMGSKYTAWYLASGVPLTILISLLRSPLAWQNRLRKFGLAAALIALPVAPWLIRNWINTGNPIFPNLYRALGGKFWSPVLDVQFYRKISYLPTLATDGRFGTFLRKPWDLVYNPHFYLALGFSAVFMVLFVLAPLTPVAYRGDRKYLLLSAFAGYLTWALVPAPANEARYLVAAVPLMALAAGCVLEQLLVAGRTLRTAGLLVPVAAFVYEISVPKLNSEELAKIGVSTMFQHLNPSVVMTGRLNRELPSGSKLLFMFDNRTLGLEHDRWVETLYEAPASMELLRGSQSASEAADRLRRLGFTHIVFNGNAANAYYFGAPAARSHPKLLPLESFERERQLVDALLNEECKHVLNVNEWKVYALQPN